MWSSDPCTASSAFRSFITFSRSGLRCRHVEFVLERVHAYLSFLKQTGNATIRIDMNVCRRWHPGQTRHGHDIAANDNQKFGTSRQPDLANRHRMTRRCATQVGVRRETVLRLGDADREVTIVLLQGVDLIAHLLIGDHLFRPIQGGRDRADLVPQGHLVGIERMEFGFVLFDLRHDRPRKIFGTSPAVTPVIRLDSLDAQLSAFLLDQFHFRRSVGRELVDRDHRFHAEMRDVRDMAFQVNKASLQGFEIFARQVSLFYTPVILQGTDRCDQNHKIRLQLTLPAFNIEELFGPEISAETGFSDHVVTKFQGRLRRHDRIAAVRNVGERTTVDKRRVAFHGLHQVRLDTIDIFAGDRLRVIDIEGRQAAELLALSQGRGDSALLGVSPSVPSPWFRGFVSSGRLDSELERFGVTREALSTVYLFDHDSHANEEVALMAEMDGIAVIAAPGQPMTPEEQTPPTDLLIWIERAVPDRGKLEGTGLPAPLADPLNELRIARATADVYEVKAGEWIQVIDVEGRQCSDFQVFPIDMLDKGIERCLDVTTTRTLMGQGYPQPGLMSKYYDQDMRPLIELVQDNCGRHDAFGLACAAKYYEDMGYPGHANCSENFNAALNPYSVAPRRGWMAMNFFYNTIVDDLNQFYLEEPWSRPGDYVLMRALEDLVCVSSACPCDIDAANGWNPTDIHVRVYGAEGDFKRSIGYRKRTDSEVEMTKETGFHPRVSTLTRNLTEYNGYWLANDYTNHGAIAEYWACREKAIIMDLSALRKFEILGPDAETLMQYTLTRNIRRLAVSQVVYTAMCYDTGTMIDDGTLFRLGPDNFRWIGGCDSGGDWLREQAEKLELEVWVKSSTDQLHNVSVQGPLSRDILKEIIWTPPAQASVEELDWFRFSIGRIGDHDGIPILVSRTGYTGELGYEVFCHPKDASAVWDSIWDIGQPLGMLPLGLEALDMLRIEAGLIFAGYEFDDQTDPFEAGIGFTVPLKSKDEDFIGREALLKRKDNPQRKLVGLELHGEEPAAHGDCVHIGRHQIGVVTSATRSPLLKKNIALCRMAVEHAEPGTEVEIGKLDGHQKRLPATVVPLSFYDPEKTRPRA